MKISGKFAKILVQKSAHVSIQDNRVAKIGIFDFEGKNRITRLIKLFEIGPIYSIFLENRLKRQLCVANNTPLAWDRGSKL